VCANSLGQLMHSNADAIGIKGNTFHNGP
jgi:hypothetical protein